MRVEVHHHEVATAGQSEIDMRFDTLTKMADKLMWYKYVIKNVARQHGKTVTFMPKPLFQDNGSGMHTHQSLWKDGKNLFFEVDGYADLSEDALHYIGGILKHAPALLAFMRADDQLLPPAGAGLRGADQPGVLAAQPLRVPSASRCTRAVGEGEAHRGPLPGSVVQRLPGLRGAADGRASTASRTRSSPAEPIDKDLYELPPEELKASSRLPGSLDDVLDSLEKDHDFLLKGDVFTQDVIETWLEYKRTNEVDAIRLRPHPYEFALYYDI